MCWILLRLGVIQLDVVVVQQTLEKAPRRRRESMLVKVKERDNVVVHRPWFTLVPRHEPFICLRPRPDEPTSHQELDIGVSDIIRVTSRL